MPTIAVASSKGGAGKTTCCLVLASEIARKGLDKGLTVAVVDVDPNKHSAKWFKKPGVPENMMIFDEVTNENILDVIAEAQDKADFVFVDLEGTATDTSVFAMTYADLTLIVCQASQNDVDEAVKIIKWIRSRLKRSQIKIHYKVFFTRLPAAYETKAYKFYVNEFKKANVPMFNVGFVEKEAYKNIHSYGGPVAELDKNITSGLPSAIQNMNAVMKELTQTLNEINAEVEES